MVKKTKPTSDSSIQIVECDEEITTWLEEKLLHSLREINSQTENSNIILTARHSKDRIAGGLIASTSYGWLLVKILWVDEIFRGSGIGQSLMQRAESSALKLGCHSAWLDTSSSVAHGFYLKSGYEVFGQLHNQGNQNPPGHQRWFMKKTL
ncbi:MAG: GNAT family N-acetyltransferase [Granulosicoccus sp.]